MLPGILKYLKYGTQFCAIEHVAVQNEEFLYGLLLSKKKGVFTIQKTFETETPKGLTKYIAAKQHLFLIINTSKVLSKSLDGLFEPEKAVSLAFQNLKLSDFYFETYTTHQKTYVALCRKAVINTILENYQSLGYNIIGFSLGNLAVSQLENLVDEPQINSSNAKIIFEAGTITDIAQKETETSDYLINGLKVRNTSVLSLSGILSYYTNRLKTTSNFSLNVAKQLQNNYDQKRFFDIGLKTGLGFIFISLLVSFLFFSNYSSKIDELNSTLALNKTQKAVLLQLTTDVQKKEKLIKDFSLTSSKTSWYLDQIGKAVPPSVSLTEIQWQPLEKNSKEDKPIKTVQQAILIKGISSKGDNFSNWLSTLEQLEWVNKVVINDYGSGKRTNTTSFELKITFKP